jgi:hypothetical protein
VTINHQLSTINQPSPMRASLFRLPLLLLTALLLTQCGSMMVPQAMPPLATDDCGPKPQNAQAVAAAWANDHYKFWPSHPFTPEEMIISEPEKVALKMPIWFPVGRPVGWQVILGPENERLMNVVENVYVRLIIRNGAVVFSEADSSRPE